MELAEIVLVTISNNADDMVCIDEVLINENAAFLTNNLIGNEGDCEGHVGACSPSAYAVLSWPVCSAEIFNERKQSETIGMHAEERFTADCNNDNRLLETDCSASQTIEATKERSYGFEQGISRSWSMTTALEFEFSASGLTGGPSTTISYEYQVGTELHLSSNQNVGSSSGISHECQGSASVPPMSSLRYSVILQVLLCLCLLCMCMCR